MKSQGRAFLSSHQKSGVDQKLKNRHFQAVILQGPCAIYWNDRGWEPLWPSGEWPPKISTSEPPESVNKFLHGQGDFADVIQLRISRWWDYRGLSKWTQYNHKALVRAEWESLRRSRHGREKRICGEMSGGKCEDIKLPEDRERSQESRNIGGP